MIKFIVIVLFINLILIKNNLIIFYYNLCYIISFLIIFIYIFKNLIYGSMSLYFGHEFYSLWLFILRIWIIGLMIMSIERIDKVKILLFINLILILIIFFSIIDLLVFYFLFEVRLIPTFFLIIYWGRNPERLRAAYYLIIYILLVSFPLVLYIFKIYMFRITLKFDLIKLIIIYYYFGVWEFFIVFTSFFIKIPIYIMHIWLPKAHVEAPVYGSIILAGILLKIGRYGIIRLVEIFFKIVINYSYLIFRVRIIGRLLIRMRCLVQVDIKRLVAYSSVVHINLILCSLLTLRKLGILRRYIIIISHGLCSSGLFYIVNLYYNRTSRRLLLLNKGILMGIPTIAIWWFLLCSANFSFPFSLGFIREILILISLLNWDIYLIVYLFIICLFRRAYSLYLFSYIQHGGAIFINIKFKIGTVKEFMVLIIHFFPLILFLLNLLVFM